MTSSYGSVKFCVFVIVYILVVYAEWAIEDDEGCRTPDHEVGSCIEIFSCKHIIDLVNAAPKPISPKISGLLRSHHCGFNGRTPKMCCPSKPIVMNELTIMRNVPILPPSDVSPPPDVSKHKNIGMLPKECGRVDTGERIVNGNKTGLFEYPWMALLSYSTPRGPDFRCGGSIINEKYILTAAHCITNIKNPLLGVRIGEHNIKTKVDCESSIDEEEICAPPFTDLAIEEIIPHPNYNTTTHFNDIGLLRVTPMDLSIENVKPVCLPLENTRIYNFTNRMCVVTGWGFTETGFISSELLQVKIPIVPNEECAERYKTKLKITHRQMCAGGGKRDSCRGDSGGPLQVLGRLHRDIRMVQQGVVSIGPFPCGNSSRPGVYTRVAHYMDWILDKIKA